MTDKPEILLVGTGAVGSFYCGKCAEAGASVSVLCRSDYKEVKEKGINIKSVLGDYHFTPAEVIDSIDKYSRHADYLVVATKVLPEIDVPSLIADAVRNETTIVLLQNGIDIEGPVNKAFPGNELISGLAFICVSRERYGHIHHEDYGKLTVGRYPGGTSPKTEAFARLLTSVNIPCEIVEDIKMARWKKLVWNAPFNPMSVLAGGATTREMINSEPSLALAKAVMGEVLTLAASRGHQIPESFITQMIENTSVMTPYKTSMLLDYENKRPMEVEAILGNTLRLAREENISLPHIESLYGLLSLVNRRNLS